jgi:hypothetical protein
MKESELNGNVKNSLDSWRWQFFFFRRCQLCFEGNEPEDWGMTLELHASANEGWNVIEYVSMWEREKEMSGVVRGTDCNESQPTETGPFLNILSLYVCVCVCTVCVWRRIGHFEITFLFSSLPLGWHSTSDRSFIMQPLFLFFFFFSPFFSADWLLIVYSKWRWQTYQSHL